jgi:DNA-binding beta-propeller fold protein YncE
VPTRAVAAVKGIAAFACAFVILTGNAQAVEPGGVQVLSGGLEYCISEDGSDLNGNADACVDGVGLAAGVNGMQVTPDGSRLHTIGGSILDGGGLAPNGNSTSTYDRDRVDGTVALQPRLRACISDQGIAPCSSGGAGLLGNPTGIAISPNGQNVYVTGRGANAVSVFDYVALPDAMNLGPLQQKASPNGCLIQSSGSGCTAVRGSVKAADVVVSPDGDHVYMAGHDANVGGIAIFNRASTGVLTQKGFNETGEDNENGCVNDNGNQACDNGSHVEPIQLAISPDGENLYAVSQGNGTYPGNPGTPGINDAINVFDINEDGTIEQKAGTDGCISQTGSGGDCMAAPSLRMPEDIAVTPDGESVYVVSSIRGDDGETSVGTMTWFSRNTDTNVGRLTEGSCFAAEAAYGCAKTDGLYKPRRILATNEGVYMTSTGRPGGSGGVGRKPAALVILNRTGADFGDLTQEPFDGCLASGFLEDCAEISTLQGAFSMAVSPDGDSLYVGGGDPDTNNGAITMFNRNDGTEPDTTIDAGVTGPTPDTDLDFTFSADKPNVFYECSLDTESFWLPCSSPLNYPNMGYGDHTLKIRATDVFDNVESTPAVRNFTVLDVTPPETTIDSGPQGEITATSASFTFSSNESGTYECRMDAQAFAACTSPKEFTGLSLGAHTFQVRATDASENVDATPAERSFTVIEEVIPPTCDTDPSLCPDPPDTKVDAVVTVPKLQKQKRGAIDIKVRIKASEAVTVKITGSVKKSKAKATLKPVSKKLAKPGTFLIHIRAASARSGRLVAAALLGSKRTTPKLLITLTDGAMNRRVVKPQIKLQGAPKKR